MADIKTVLTPEDIKKLMDGAPWLRDEAMIAFMASTGVRVSELIAFHVKDCDFKKNIVIIPHLKQKTKAKCDACGKHAGARATFCTYCGAPVAKNQVEEPHTRIINVSPTAMKLIHDYIVANKKKPDDRVFAIARQQVYERLRLAAKNAGLAEERLMNPETNRLHFISPHRFRDALAVDWLAAPIPKDDAGTPRFSEAERQKALQVQLGHKKFETTARYQKLMPETTKDIGEAIRESRGL